MKKTDIIITIAGVLLLGAGLLLLKRFPAAHGGLLALPYVCIGVGCGTFGQGMGRIVSRRALKNSPALQKQQEIEQRDERNAAISNRAKGKAYDRMVFVFGALMVCFALMDIALAAVLLLVCAYLFVVGCNIYYRMKYEKEM